MQKYCNVCNISCLFVYKFVYNFRTVFFVFQRIMSSNVYECFRVYVSASFSPEVTWGGAEAALDAGHALYLAMDHIVVELGIRGARGIVADAGKLAHADVVVRLEVLVECIGQLGGCEGLAPLALT